MIHMPGWIGKKEDLMMKKILSTLDMAKFTFVKHLLDQESIPYLEKGSYFNGGAAGEVPPLVYSPELWVHEGPNFEKALVLVKRSDLQVFQSEDWVCSNCDELIESQFGTCWKCGVDRGGA
jgi:hypothetical protein